MKEYIKVNVNEYVNKCLSSGCEVISAEKTARVKVRKCVLNERVISWSQDSEGKEIIEKVVMVSEPNCYVLTKVDSKGNAIIDKNGHTNEWVVNSDVIERKYEPDYSDILKPKGGVQKFVIVPENIILEQWGSETKIAQGGYINITNTDDMYGISERDFNDTYQVVEEMTLRRKYEKR